MQSVTNRDLSHQSHTDEGADPEIGLWDTSSIRFSVLERDAEGVDRVGNVEGIPPPQLTRGLGSWERRKLPSGVRGRAPAEIEFCKI